MKCYNGCPDNELQKKLDEINSAFKKLKKLNPEVHCTFHPYERVWAVHEWGRPISGYRKTQLEALIEAIEILEKEETIRIEFN